MSAKLSILVVDDHRDILDLLRHVFELTGFEVVTAQDGEEALVRFQNDHPAAIVLDLNLPRLPGWEVYQRVRAQSNVPIVIITGNVMLASAAQEVMKQADACFIKPFDVLALVERLRKLLDTPRPSTFITTAGTL